MRNRINPKLDLGTHKIMKKLKLQNESYKLFVANYKEWLDILGYAESTVYYLPNHLQEFFYYLEQNGIKNINQITTKTVKKYLFMVQNIRKYPK